MHIIILNLYYTGVVIRLSKVACKMATTPTQTQADGRADDSTNSSQLPQSDEEGEDVGELEGGNIRRESQPIESKIDANVLKNEILVDGMQV